MRFVRVLYALLVLGPVALILGIERSPAGVGLLTGGLLVLLASFVLEARLRRSGAAAREMLFGMAGLFLGLLVGALTLFSIERVLLIEYFATPRSHVQIVYLLFLATLGYVGLVAGRAVAPDLATPARAPEALLSATRFLLGERGLIDGRAVRLAQSPLLAGEIVVPRYVVDSLQTLAASRVPVEHVRGERGLENLRALQQIPTRPVRIREIDTARGEVAGLLDFAQLSDTRIITQNEELLAEAARRGIQAIDINRAAEMLKPDVIQGDELVVKLVKPGKEREQAVGYMEDGNMVVVENAREDLGKTVRVTVTGIHQTRAGTLIFGSKKEGSAA